MSGARFDLQVQQQRLESRLFGAGDPVRLGRFSILEQVGRGGMGWVYAAYDPDLDRRVAIKVLGPRGGEAETRRLLREAKALAKLSHANVVTVHEIGVRPGDADQVFIAMEYVAGGTLARWARTLGDGPDRFEKVLARMRECIAGLSAAHAAGIVHRDFKPANVLISTDGKAKVADFGLARSELADPSTRDTTDVAASPTKGSPTSTARFGGTPAYMAPEQIAGEADPRSDQFSLCATFFEIFYGRRPFDADDPAARLRRIREGALDRPRRTDVPEWMFLLLARGLRADPTERFDNLRTLDDAIEHALRPRRRMLPALAVVAVAGGAVAAMWSPRRPLPAVAAPIVPCLDGRTPLEPVWGASRQAAVRKAFERTEQPIWRGVWERVDAPMRTWAEAWSDATLASCEATRVYGTQSEHLHEVRTACLQRQLDEVGGLSEELAAATPESIYEVPRKVSLLPRVDDCADPSNLEFAGGRVDLTSPVVVAYFEHLDRADAYGADRLRPLAELEVSAAAMLASEHEIPELAALAYERLATLQETAGDLDVAAQSARTALSYAEQTGDRERIGLAWYRLADLAFERDDPAATDFDLERARSFLEGPGVRQEVLATLLSLEAKQRQRAGDHLGSARAHLRAAAMLEQIGLRPTDALNERREASVMLSMAGLVDEADRNAREVVATSERIFGPDHPSTLFAKIRRAEQLREVGRHEDAVELTSYVVEHMPPEAGMPARNRYGFIGVHATALRLAGRTDEALRVLEDALAQAEREQGPLARPTTTLRSFYALALSGQDRAEEALPHYAKLLEACATSEEGTCIPINRGGTHVNYAEARSKVGRHDEAVAQLDAALEILDKVLADVSPRRFDMTLVAGQILARAGRTQAARARLEEGLRIAAEVEVDPKHLQQMRDTLADLD